MVFFNEDEGRERYGTVIAALGMDPKKLTDKYLEALGKEFGCSFERGELLIWVEATEDRAEEIFEILRKRSTRF